MRENMRLATWERGISLTSRSDPKLFAFLWFYEWHLFDAVRSGEHTVGSHDWQWSVDEQGQTARMDAGWLTLSAQAQANGADLVLEIANHTDRDWPAIAALIPCLNPGDPQTPAARNPLFLDEGHAHTYFRGAQGLDLIKGAFPREIHFNRACRPAIMAWEREREDGAFVFAEKWPHSDRDAYAGLMVRESSDQRYVMGIGWESFLSAQGHNPWNCMHLSIKVGPLVRGAKRTVRGKIYLFEGAKEECLEAYEGDFSQAQK